LKLSCDKANIILKWYPTLDFETTIDFTTKWYSQYYDKKEMVYELTMRQINGYVLHAKQKELKWAID